MTCNGGAESLVLTACHGQQGRRWVTHAYYLLLQSQRLVKGLWAISASYRVWINLTELLCMADKLNIAKFLLRNLDVMRTLQKWKTRWWYCKTGLTASHRLLLLLMHWD